MHYNYCNIYCEMLIRHSSITGRIHVRLNVNIAKLYMQMFLLHGEREQFQSYIHSTTTVL